MKQYNIANLNLKIEGPEYPYCTQRMKEYSVIENDECDVYIDARESQSIDLPKGKRLGKMHHWEWIKTETGQYAAFQRHPVTGQLISLMEADTLWKNIKLRLVHFENNLDITVDKRIFFAIGHVFTYAVLRRGGLMLHSSAISYKGNGILFSAPSGTGKSTHASLWRKYYDDTVIINDDMPAIIFEGDEPKAFGTPWSGKTDINCNMHASLVAIVFLERGQSCAIKRISGATLLSHFLNELRKSLFPEMMDICLESLNKLLQVVPVFLLSCDISKDAVDIVKSTIFK